MRLRSRIAKLGCAAAGAAAAALVGTSASATTISYYSFNGTDNTGQSFFGAFALRESDAGTYSVRTFSGSYDFNLFSGNDWTYGSNGQGQVVIGGIPSGTSSAGAATAISPHTSDFRIDYTPGASTAQFEAATLGSDIATGTLTITAATPVITAYGFEGTDGSGDPFFGEYTLADVNGEYLLLAFGAGGISDFNSGVGVGNNGDGTVVIGLGGGDGLGAVGGAHDFFIGSFTPGDTEAYFAVAAGSLGIVQGTVQITPLVQSGAPEPASWALMILGFGGAGAALRRRRGAAGLA